MRKWVIFIAIVIIIASLVYTLTGDGAFKKKFTVSGIVTVHVGGATTCYIDSEAHGISCLPDWFINHKDK